MRNAFIDELVLAARNGKNVALIVGDLGYKVVEPFADEFPKRFYNAGIAEQNMMGMAAGLASEGVHVFCYSIANFPTFRCAEQIRNDVDYHNLSVTVVTVGGGLAYGALGYSHHAIQDYALMRTMPNMLIAAPGDPYEVRGCMRYLLDNPGPSYLRLGKAGEVNLHTVIPKLTPGSWVPLLLKQSKGAILTTGAVLEMAHRFITTEDIACDLYSLPLWGMKTKSSQKYFLEKYSKLLTYEDHLIDGGFGSWMLEVRATFNAGESNPCMELIALKPEVCGVVGQQPTLNSYGGLDLSKKVTSFT